MVRTPAEAEQFVREYWQYNSPFWGSRGHDGKYRINFYGFYGNGHDTPEAAWTAAAEFTEQRQEEIRQVEAEMLCANIHAFTAANNCLIAVQKGQANKAGRWARHTITRSRILAREQAALESLKKGWIA